MTGCRRPIILTASVDLLRPAFIFRGVFIDYFKWPMWHRSVIRSRVSYCIRSSASYQQQQHSRHSKQASPTHLSPRISVRSFQRIVLQLGVYGCCDDTPHAVFVCILFVSVVRLNEEHLRRRRFRVDTHSPQQISAPSPPPRRRARGCNPSFNGFAAPYSRNR